MKVLCPDCGKPLRFMDGHCTRHGAIKLFHCDDCIDGLDSDWRVIYVENRIKKIEKYYFG